MTPQKRQTSFTGEIVHFLLLKSLGNNHFWLLVKLQKALIFSLLYKMIFPFQFDQFNNAANHSEPDLFHY